MESQIIELCSSLEIRSETIKTFIILIVVMGICTLIIGLIFNQFLTGVAPCALMGCIVISGLIQDQISDSPSNTENTQEVYERICQQHEKPK